MIRPFSRNVIPKLRNDRFVHFFWRLKDPYILRNHLGGLECRLCLTLHTNEGSYLAHTQGKKHQTNLARRAAKDAKDSSLYQSSLLAQQAAQTRLAITKKQFIKIGSPGYQVTKVRDPMTAQLGLLFQIHYPQIADEVKPRHRFMSSFEQHVETADRAHQYLLVYVHPPRFDKVMVKPDLIFLQLIPVGPRICLHRLLRSLIRPSRSNCNHKRLTIQKASHGITGTWSTS